MRGENNFSLRLSEEVEISLKSVDTIGINYKGFFCFSKEFLYHFHGLSGLGKTGADNDYILIFYEPHKFLE